MTKTRKLKQCILISDVLTSDFFSEVNSTYLDCINDFYDDLSDSTINEKIIEAQNDLKNLNKKMKESHLTILQNIKSGKFENDLREEGMSDKSINMLLIIGKQISESELERLR